MFVSRRERDLWLATGVVVAAIFATLVFAGSLAQVVRDRGLTGAAFVLGALLVVLAILALGPGPVRRPSVPGSLRPALAVVVIAFAMLAVARLTSDIERSHLVEYGIVGALVHAALVERRGGRGLWAPALAAVVVTIAIGVADEAVQAIVPGRVADPVDVAFNAFAAVAAVGAGVALRLLRSRGQPAAEERPDQPA